MPFTGPELRCSPLRLAALRRTGLQVPARQPELDRLASLAALVANAPFALVTMVDADREVVVGAHSLPPALAGVAELPTSHSLGAAVVESGGVVRVDDSRATASSPEHGGLADYGLASYLAVPLSTGDGHVIGSLCVADGIPRTWDATTPAALLDLARLGAAGLEPRRRSAGREGWEGALLRALLESTEELISVIDAGGHIRYANSALTRVLGLTAGDVLGTSVFDLVHPEDAAMVGRLFDELLRQPGGVVTAECRVRHRAGGWRVLSTTAHNRLHEPGLAGLVLSSRDTTERAYVEAALRQSEARLAEAQRVGCIGSWSLDVAAGDVTASAEMFRLFGRAPVGGVLPLDEFLAAIHPEDRGHVGHQIDGAGPTFAIQFRVPQRDGSTRVLRALGERRRGPDGAVCEVVGASQDVTAQAAAEHALRRSEERFRLAAEATREMVYDADLVTGHVARQGAVAEILREDPSALAPSFAGWLELVHPDDRDRVNAELTRALASGVDTWMAEYRMLRGGGEGVAYVLDRARVVRDAAGRPTRLIGAVTDVTERHVAEAALRASEARFRNLVEAAHDGIWALDAAGRTTYVNPRLTEMLGHPAGAMLGRPLFDFMDEEQAFEARTLFARRQRGIAESHTFRLRRADGTSIWTELSSSPLYDEDGGFAGALALVSDVTERRLAASALAESEARLREIAEGVADLFWLGDFANGETLYVSPAFERVLGRPVPALREVRDQWVAAIHPGDVDRVLADWEMRDRQLQTDYRIVRPGGEVRWVQTRIFPMYDDGGSAYRRAAVTRDVTAERHVQERLRKSEARLRLALEAAGMIVWERDLQSDRVHDEALPPGSTGEVQPSSSRFGSYADFLAAVHPGDRERVDRANAEAVARRGTFSVEYRVTDAAGATRWKHTVGQVVLGGSDGPAKLVGVTHDVTERVALEAQLRRAQKLEAVGRLAGGVAHDFNNLVQVITANALLAGDRLPAGDAARYHLAEIEAAAGRAATLTRQLLAFSRQQTLKVGPLSLNRVVTAVEPMLRRVIGAQVALETDLRPDLALVAADAGQLEQVLMNLVLNARDALPEGGRVTIETRDVRLDARAAARHPGLAAGAYVALRVVDTGVGMDHATETRMFEPFFTTKEAGKGTGLGLASVYGIVKQSGGHVWAESAPGEGTTFTVLLPACDGHPDDAGAQVPLVRSVAPRGGAVVLVVEDDPSVRSSIRHMLERRGYPTLEADGGAEALRILEESSGGVDLVLTDLTMPGMSASHLLDRLRERHPRLRVLLMSGRGDLVDGHPGAGRGIELLAKPFTADDLVRSVRAALDAPSPL